MNAAPTGSNPLLRNLAWASQKQNALSVKRISHFDGRPVKRIGGADVGFLETKQGSLALAAIVVLSYPELQLIEQAIALERLNFPYVPGFLGFREVPALKACFRKLKQRPDLILCDGQGIAHPRGFGLAAHLGVELNLPTIGCAKSRLVGRHIEPSRTRGSRTPLLYKQREVGTVLRTRSNVKPLFISCGHLMDLELAVGFVMKSTTRYRLPEPTRLADRLTKQVKRLLLKEEFD